MKFVDNVLLKGKTRPAAVLPRKTGVYNLRWTMNPFGLEMRGWVRVFLVAVQSIEIEASRLHSSKHSMMIASGIPFQWQNPLFWSNDVYLYFLG
jgi:hypothetical protein